jgi:peptidoglycan/LPS O-acetylase OafA/YrhL
VSLLNRPQSNAGVSEAVAQTRRIPALDGWRGIAILLVLFDHIQAALFGRYWLPWMQTGQHGVTIFFVLSGFLITSKLLETPTHRIDLKSFYIRRFFRLMPVAWAYLAVLWISGEISRQRWISGGEIASCVLFFRNFFGPGRSLYAAHFWSLSIEEQFYLVWPCLLLLAGIRISRWFAVGGALAIAIYREMHWASYECQWLSFQTQVRADALLVGCLLALLLADPKLRSLTQRWCRFGWIPALAILLWAVARFHWLPPLFECVAIAGLIASSAMYSQSIFVRPLLSPSLIWMGKISYSVYVWQQFFFVHRGVSVTAPVLCLMPVFALGSYSWIELPAARLGRHITEKLKRKVSVTNPACALTSPTA